MTKIRTTIRPDEEIDVDATELAHLETLGLVYKGGATTDEGAVKAVEKAQAADVKKPSA